MASNPFAPLLQAAPAQQASGNVTGSRNAPRRGRAGGVAGVALKRAGLVDEDSGMRDVSAAGPSRGQRGRGQTREGNGVRPGGAGGGKAASSARARANPMGARPAGAHSSRDPLVSGQAFGIRGAGKRKDGPIAVSDLIRNGGGGKGKGRIPGGGAHDGSLLTRIDGSAKSAPQSTSKTVSILKSFLASRYNAEAQFLNLESMATDPILLREGIKPPGTAGAHKDIGSVLWKLCKESYPNITTLSLAKNDLKSLVPVSTLPEFLPGLRNLSLQDNDIKWVRDLTFHMVRSRGAQAKFSSLQELILTGNPVQANAVSAGNEQGYRGDVLARFPDLKMLDQQPVTPNEHNFKQLPGAASSSKDQVGIAQGAANAGVEVRDFPLAIPHGNFVDQNAESIVPPFLAKFFELFDANRDSLRPAYAADATFSIITSSAVPPRARSAGYLQKLPRQRDLNWKVYKEVVSHNLMQLGTRPASKGLPGGPGAILSTFKKMPKTTHPLTDAAKFAFDAWLLPNDQIKATMASADGGANAASTKPDALLFINVHGEFAESPSQGVRSFSRCFVVAPVVPGSTAANLGWPCVILSDQLTVRQYAGVDAWNKTPAAASANPVQGASGSSVAQPLPSAAALPAHLQSVAPAASLTPEQHSMSLQLAAQTNLTYPFAVQCLSENGWNAQVAFERFQALKASGAIPPQAFAVQG